jgi:hypothetical protein
MFEFYVLVGICIWVVGMGAFGVGGKLRFASIFGDGGVEVRRFSISIK